MKKMILSLTFLCWSNLSLAGYLSYFSPESNLLDVVSSKLQSAEKSIDISIYSFSNTGIRDILINKIEEGIKVRILINNGKSEKVRHFLRPLTEIGADARYVSKINHHKFIVIDQEILLNSSGNLTGTTLSQTYDENLIVCDECSDRIATYQHEFDELHQYGSPVNPDYAVIFPSTNQSILEMKNPRIALFTSSNFIPYLRSGKISFKKNSRTEYIVGDVDSTLVDAIHNAQESIHIATGHFRSKPLYDAIISAIERGVEVNIVLDGQEYISYSAQNKENKKVKECMTQYNDYVKCYKSGLHFGRLLASNGAKLRFKYYMLRWFFPMAPQMHHKYMIIDQSTLYSGSYNWSYNAEFESFENIGIYTDSSIVTSYLNNFNLINNYGNANEGYIKKIQEYQQANDSIETVFEPISLTLKQIDFLRSTAYKKCQNLYQNSAADRVCFTKK